MKKKKIIKSLLLLASISGFANTCQEEKTPVEINSLTAFEDSPSKGSGVFFTSDALIFNAYQEGTEFGLTRSNNISENTPYIGSLKRPNFAYKWGWRVGLGYHTPFDNWEILANWTSFNPSASKFLTSNSGHNILNITSVYDSNLLFQSASSFWKLRLNVGSLNLGKRFYISKHLELKPNVGIRTAWIHQKITDSYYNTLPNSTYSGSLDKMHYVNQYWGIGIEAGINSNWDLGKGFSILGNISSSNITGIYHLSLTETFDASLVGNTFEKPHATKAMTDFQLGLRYEKLINDYFYLSLQAAWEQHIYYNQLQWQGSVPTPTPNGDLGVSGFSFSVRLGF